MDSLTEEFLKNIQVYLPVEVVNVYNNSLVDVMPLIYNELELPIINQVPIEHLGSDEKHSIKFKVEKGHHGIIFLSQLDLSLYMETGEKSKCNTDETFNLTNAKYCPFLQWRKGGVSTPSDYDIEIKFPKIKIVGDLDIIGNIKHTGDTEQTGNLTVSSKITTQELLVNGNSELKGGTTIQDKPFLTHAHSGVESGPNNTGGVS